MQEGFCQHHTFLHLGVQTKVAGHNQYIPLSQNSKTRVALEMISSPKAVSA
jgi:hypothetical protein